MIDFVKGSLAYKGDSTITVETAAGIGYEINVAANSPFFLKNTGESVMVYTVLMVKEDDMSLYGFSDRGSLSVFRKLISVSGIGAKAAMAIFSVMPAEEIKRAIVFEDSAAFTKASGIGKKTAQRIVLELKDHYGSTDIANSSSSAVKANAYGRVSISEEAIYALMELGYTRNEAADAVASVSGENLTIEDYIRAALRNF